MSGANALGDLLEEIRRCRICRDEPKGTPLPHEPNPVCVPSSVARIAICGQAPGVRVHASGRPFTDPSGDRLRQWLGVDETQFYDPSLFAIVPMGFCFPGHDAKGGDLPPRSECVAQWHDRLFSQMEQIDLVLSIGQYAHAYHLKGLKRKTLTETVADWQEIFDLTAKTGRPVLPLPHPSWRNSGWLKKNPWFEARLLPFLRAQVHARM